MDWADEKAKEIINNNPDIKRWGVAMDIAPFAQALRDAEAEGFAQGCITTNRIRQGVALSMLEDSHDRSRENSPRVLPKTTS